MIRRRTGGWPGRRHASPYTGLAQNSRREDETEPVLRSRRAVVTTVAAPNAAPTNRKSLAAGDASGPAESGRDRRQASHRRRGQTDRAYTRTVPRRIAHGM